MRVSLSPHVRSIRAPHRITWSHTDTLNAPRWRRYGWMLQAFLPLIICATLITLLLWWFVSAFVAQLVVGGLVAYVTGISLLAALLRQRLLREAVNHPPEIVDTEGVYLAPRNGQRDGYVPHSQIAAIYRAKLEPGIAIELVDGDVLLMTRPNATSHRFTIDLQIVQRLHARTTSTTLYVQ